MGVIYVLLFVWTALFQYCDGVAIPPKIIRQGPKDIYYKVFESVVLECDASGSPRPTFSWKRAEKLYTPSGNDDRVVQQTDKGTLIINRPEDKDEGFYQCFATNDFGVAATIKYNLRMAKLDEFKVKTPYYHQPHVGAPLHINCSSPDSVPDARVYWAVNEGRGMAAIRTNERVTMDLDDGLHFISITKEDAQNGRPYQCVAYNKRMRRQSLGPPHYIQPVGTESSYNMQKAWPLQRFDESGLVGENFRMKCIFTGNPLPIVKWSRHDKQPFNERVQPGRSFGKELSITDLQLEDSGIYVCEAEREQEATPKQMSISLKVYSRPTWVVKPKDVLVGEGATAEFECKVDGYPTPKIKWFINGQPMEEAMKKDDRLDASRFHRLEETKIVFERVLNTDFMVFQCNATNIHGYLWGEAYLSVLSEAPTIVKKPVPVKVAEGQSYIMTCEIMGRPDPIVTWYKDDVQITGGRFHIMPAGSLNVSNAVLADSGRYYCHAHNDFGDAGAEGTLIVRRKTLIEWKPRDLEVRSGVNAKFTCSGTTDPGEAHNLVTRWMKDQKYVELGTRMFLNMQDNSLTISGTEERDSGTYVCVVSNGLDNDTYSARLVVTSFPDRPNSVYLDDACVGISRTELRWMPGSFNNAPIQYFRIEYMTTRDPDRWNFAAKVSYTQSSLCIVPVRGKPCTGVESYFQLKGGLDYKFRVISYNKIGESFPSNATSDNCKTQATRPTQNPQNVRTIGDIPGRLHIEWTPVPPEHQGGDSFFYRLTFNRVGDEQTIYTREFYDWRTYQYNTSSSGHPYQAYKISLRSMNNLGNSKGDVETIIGHSAEGMPNISPYELTVLESKAETVTLQWKFDRSEIGKIMSLIRGEFRGFLVQIWDEVRKGETIQGVELAPEYFDMNSTIDIFNATIRHQRPRSNLMARVAVMNNYYVSRPTEDVRFISPTGFPSPVEYMEDYFIGDNHITLQWKTSRDNKDVIGYDIGYQEVKGLELSEMTEMYPQIDDPYATQAMLGGLKANTKYRIYLWARTIAGRGEGYFIERKTSVPRVLPLPRFTISAVDRTSINISWWVDMQMDSGTVVYVQYKKDDGAEWFSSSPDPSRTWTSIPLLQPGIKYNIRVVVTNGFEERFSEMEDVTTSGNAKGYDIIENLGWFLGMIISILLHFTMIGIFIWCYQRGFRFNQGESRVRTYVDGDDTYTDKSAIPRSSMEFQDQRGYSNDYYRDGDYGGEDDRYDDNDEGGFNDWKDNKEDYNQRNDNEDDYNQRNDNEDDYNQHDYDYNRQYDNYDDDYDERARIGYGESRYEEDERPVNDKDDDGYDAYNVGNNAQTRYNTESRGNNRSYHDDDVDDVAYSYGDYRASVPRHYDERRSDEEFDDRRYEPASLENTSRPRGRDDRDEDRHSHHHCDDEDHSDHGRYGNVIDELRTRQSGYGQPRGRRGQYDDEREDRYDSRDDRGRSASNTYNSTII